MGPQVLKRQAESLVGRDEEVGDESHDREAQEFRTRLGTELEKVSLLYVKHERKMCRFFMSLEAKTDALYERIEQQRCDCARSHEERVRGLLEQPANRQLFVALTAYLVHMDALRNFALLNMLALLKIANHHCSKPLRDDILGRLYQEPFYQCYRLTSLVDEIDTLQRTLLSKCFGHVVKSMSPHSSNDDMLGIAHSDAMEEEEHRTVRREGTSPAGSSCDLEQESRGTTLTDARDLAAYCTWVNQKGRLPAWVCKGCEDPAQLSTLAGDVRAVRVVPLVVGFARQLQAALEHLSLVHLMPNLIHSPQLQQKQQQQHQMACGDMRQSVQQKVRTAHLPQHVSLSSSQRDSPGRRLHSPERTEPHKRQCLSPHAPPARPPVGGWDITRCSSFISSGGAAAGRLQGGGGGGGGGGSTLRPQRCFYDLRLLDLQSQRDDIGRGRGGLDPLCVVQQAALDLSYLSLAMGSPCNSPLPTRPNRLRESMPMSTMSSQDSMSASSRGSSGRSAGHVSVLAGSEEGRGSWHSSLSSGSSCTCDAETVDADAERDAARMVDVQAPLAATAASCSRSMGIPLMAAGPSFFSPWAAAAHPGVGQVVAVANVDRFNRIAPMPA